MRKKTSITEVPKVPLLIGLGGTTPFIIAAVLIWIAKDPWKSFIFLNLINYCLVIISFLGAIHWGSTMIHNRKHKFTIWYIWSVIPACIAWVSVMGGLKYDVLIMILMIGFIISFIVDAKGVRMNLLPNWYLTLRKILTLIAVLSLFSVFIYLSKF